jgi:hypothetical protein
MHKKKTLFLVAFIAMLACLSVVNASERSIKECMISDLETIRNTFDFHYAPREWKKMHSNWSLEAKLQIAKDKIRQIDKITRRDYHSIVRDFFRSIGDYHVSVEFYATEAATLPFRVKGAEGKYFITEIDRSQLSPKVFPWNIGDELVMFDGRPTQETIDALINNEIGIGNLATDTALAEIVLTYREASQGHQVPKGPLLVTIKSVKTAKLSSYQLIWDYTPEKILDGFPPTFPLHTACITSTKLPSFNVPKISAEYQLLSPIYSHLAHTSHPETGHDPGARESFLPPLGEISWETDETNAFHAYLCETPDGASLGYIRINEYVGHEFEVEEFGEIITFLEENSDALVIDQINNPGGSVFYMYALASMLTEQPLFTPRHRSSISPQEIATAVKLISAIESANTEEDAQILLGETFSGTPVTLQMIKFLLNYFRFLLSEWDAGRTLTTPFYLYGIDCINPHPTVRYTKPLIILVNHLSFSGGDFLPAIFQDNKRAIILGTQTAGAGGHMTSTSFPNRFGIKSFTYTRSIAERLDKTPIEGSGVTPNIIYSLTQDDLQYNYRGYVHAIQKAVNKLLE